jgi:Domain of unknown function (DUF4383)
MTTRSQGNYRNMATKGTSLAKGPASIIGMILLAYGVTGLIFGGNTFDSHPLDGTVNGETWLGIEGNGWSNLLAIGAGGVLMFGAQLHWAARATSLVVGLGFAAAAVIGLVDGDDVLGIFACNDATILAWAITAAVLVVVGLLPRVGRRRDPDPVVATTEPPPDDTTIERTRESRFDRESDRTETR